MLTLFTGCISPRSLDGLILNSKFDDQFISAQTQITNDAIDRLVNQTEIQPAGWRRITPLTELFKKYKVNLNSIKLESMTVYHNRIANNQMTFQARF